jgi:hypothetical protein
MDVLRALCQAVYCLTMQATYVLPQGEDDFWSTPGPFLKENEGLCRTIEVIKNKRNLNERRRS